MSEPTFVEIQRRGLLESLKRMSVLIEHSAGLNGSFGTVIGSELGLMIKRLAAIYGHSVFYGLSEQLYEHAKTQGSWCTACLRGEEKRVEEGEDFCPEHMEQMRQMIGEEGFDLGDS